jgi:hypothetical protein
MITSTRNASFALIALRLKGEIIVNNSVGRLLLCALAMLSLSFWALTVPLTQDSYVVPSSAELTMNGTNNRGAGAAVVNDVPVSATNVFFYVGT